jgi:hypothetical protein
LRETVVNQSGINPPITFQTEQLVTPTKPGEGKVFDHWWTTHENQLKICQNMSLANCQKFYLDKERKMQELIKVCSEFDLTCSSWKKVREVYEEMTAFQLLGFLERYPLIHSTYEFAKSLGVPRFFFEEYAAAVPEYELEEDIEFLNETKRLASTLVERAKLSQKAIGEMDLSSVRSEWPDIYRALVAFSREYKFLKTEDWAAAPPIEKAFSKVIDQIKMNDFEITHKKTYAESEEEFFVDCPELRDRIRLSIVKKLQQNNIHHVRPRAQWYLRDQLLTLGEFLVENGTLNNPEEILSVSLDRLERFISQYESQKQ